MKNAIEYPVSGVCNEPVAMFCGSRSLSSKHQPLVNELVRSLLEVGARLSVGCASGADSLVVFSVLALGAGEKLDVFAVGGASGNCFAGRASCYSGVHRALHAGASVSWWAGGGSSLPLRARLVGRSLSCIRSVAGGGQGSLLIALVSDWPARPFSSGAWPSCGSGTWSSVAAAARQGLPVVVVPLDRLEGVQADQLPLLQAGGCWVKTMQFALVPAFQWQPAKQLF